MTNILTTCKLRCITQTSSSSFRILKSRAMSSGPTLAEKQKTFLSNPHFAVVGASLDQSKYGTKVLKWYIARDKPVIPVHPKEDSLEGIKTIRSISDLPSPTETSISIITPGKITLEIIEAAKDLNVPSLWLQPGAENDDVKAYIAENNLGDKVILGGPCILVEGDGIIKSLL